MDDEKGLDLSLGLPCGGNTVSQKGICSSSSEPVRSSGDDRGSKLINEFKNFLEGGNQHSLYGQFPKTSLHMETSKCFSNTGGNWLAPECRSTEFEDEGRSVAGEKRKNMFIKIDPKKKHVAEINHGDFTENAKASHILIADEGSTAENEDVADSEADGDGSSSKHEDTPKQYASSSSACVTQKDGFGDSERTEILGQKQLAVSSENEHKLTDISMRYNVSFSTHQATMTVSFSQAIKDLKSSGTLCLPSYPLPGIMHAIGSSNADRTSVQSVQPASIPLTFGYCSTQLPTLDRDNSRGLVSNNQQFHTALPGRNQANHNTQVAAPVVSDHCRVLEHGRGNGKQQHMGGQEDSSSHTAGDAKDPPGQSQADAIPSEFQAIRPGMAADLRFGGCGSYPNLPWVSTTGPGPNGRTISGVTYRFSPTQIKIVCACHGSHLSPEEFVRHASEDTNTPPDSASPLASLPSSNPAASART